MTRETSDQDFALHRQLFLAEQGYRYEITEAAAVLAADGGLADVLDEVGRLPALGLESALEEQRDSER